MVNVSVNESTGGAVGGNSQLGGGRFASGGASVYYIDRFVVLTSVKLAV
eukprot:SAG11_NODE_24032_length_379_cov_0.714286_1_plen_48_part_10